MGTEAPLRSAIHAMVLYAFFWSSPPLAYGQTMSLNGMVVSPHPMSAQAGLLILQQGGNAFDAAVATAATAAVVDRIANGSPGGCGRLRDDLPRRKRSRFARSTTWERHLERLGRSSSSTELDSGDTGHPSRDSFRGPVVPGNLAALAALLETYGTMSWPEVLAPAIEYAEKGVAVTPRMHDAYAGVPTGRYPYGASIWYEKDGRPVPVGGILKQTDLAATLRRIARDGPGVLYGGELAEQIVAYFEEKGGIFTHRGLRRVSGAVARSHRDELPGVRSLWPPAGKRRDDGAPDAQHSRALRRRRPRTQHAGFTPPDVGGPEARVHR